MIDEPDAFIEPKSFLVIKFASGSHLETLLQQSLYQQDIGTIVHPGIVGQPSTAMNGNLLRPLIFHIDIDESERRI